METTEHQGRTLKLARVAADVQAKSIAEEMGVSQSRMSKIEQSPNLDPETISRYRAALDTCALRRTSAAA